MSIPDAEANTTYLTDCERVQKFMSGEYLLFHGYIATTICLLGCAANAVNIVVLSRKEMASITNSILTALAVADFLVMIIYMPFAVYKYTNIFSSKNNKTYSWAIYVYFFAVFSQIFHTVSILLTIILASWRYIAIKFPLKSNRLCTKRNTVIAITFAYAVSPILCLPIFFATQIQEIPRTSVQIINFNGVSKGTVPLPPKYVVRITEDETLSAATFWIYSVLIKLIPCTVLTILSVLLVVEMKLSDRKRKNLLESSSPTTANEGDKARLQHTKSIDRTTRMLLGLLGLFIATELPQGVMGLMTAIAPQIFGLCYYSLGYLSDLLALLGAAVNFVLYCSMSQQFRTTFARLARTFLPLPKQSLAVIPMVQRSPENIEER